MSKKTNILDILKGNDGKFSLRAVGAFQIIIAFCSAGLLDAAVKGVEVSEGFYWACVAGFTSLIATRAMEHIAAIRSGKSTIEQNRNNFDQQINNIEQQYNNSQNDKL